MADLPEPFPAPESLAELRKGVLNLTEMAEAIGVDKGQLSRWESGKGEMAYARIRRYVQVLNLRASEADPRRFLAARIANTQPLWELRATDRLERALQIMVWNGFSQLPVLDAQGREHVGLLTDRALCAALATGDVATALDRTVGTLALDELPRVPASEVYGKVARLLAEHPMVLVEDESGAPVGFATPADLFPVALGKWTAGGRVRAGAKRGRKKRPG